MDGKSLASNTEIITMQVTCKSHGDHMQVTWRSHAGHMEITCKFLEMVGCVYSCIAWPQSCRLCLPEQLRSYGHSNMPFYNYSLENSHIYHTNGVVSILLASMVGYMVQMIFFCISAPLQVALRRCTHKRDKNAWNSTRPRGYTIHNELKNRHCIWKVTTGWLYGEQLQYWSEQLWVWLYTSDSRSVHTAPSIQRGTTNCYIIGMCTHAHCLVQII